jgi:DNA polymerase III epsilon subunit family exonuclease
MDRHIDEIEFTIFDTETTGLEPESGDRIIEIAAIRFKKDEKLGIFQSLVNPQRPLPLSAQRINNITEEMLKAAPTINEILPDFFAFIKGSTLCAYNASFDFGFLKNEARLINLLLPDGILIIDLLKMSKKLLPNLGHYPLWFVAESLGVRSEGLHRAFKDVEVSFEIFKKLKRILFDKGIDNFAEFLNLFCLEGKFLDDLNFQKIAKIQEAVDKGINLKIKYFSLKDAEVSIREVIPKEIKQQNQHTYLVAHCLLRNEERNFNIDGILHIEIL